MTYRILLLDTEPLELIALKLLLDQDERVTLVTVSTAQELLEAMEADPADLILSDLEMPGRDGMQTIQEIRQSHPDCLILVQTSYTSPDSTISALQAGITDYIVKPCSPENIHSRLENAMARIANKRSRAESEKKEFLRQIAASINHEINNPLTVIMGIAELMLAENHHLDPKVRRDLETIISHSLRIREVTCRMRDLPEIRTTKYVASDEMIDLRIPEPSATHEKPKRTDGIPPSHIAIVDDNSLMVSMLKRMLGSTYKIDGYTTGKAFLKAVTETPPPDVVLIEMQLLEACHGADFLREIHSIRKNLPIVLLTTYHDEEKIAAALRNGAIGPLYKPIYSQELKKIVHDALTPPPNKSSESVARRTKKK